MTDKSDQRVIDLLSKGVSIDNVADRLNRSPEKVRDIAVEHLGFFKMDPKKKARLKKYLVAEKHADAHWPFSKEIGEARKKYEAGLVELFQGRDGVTFYLYAIPRKKKITRPPYFFARTFE